MGFQGSFAVAGAIYRVTPDGALRWYQYTGAGEQDPGGTNGWAPNSGNQIGRGWSDGFRTFFGTQNVIYAVDGGGLLRWYRYNGTGAADPGGTSSDWDPNSGNIIGNGWSLDNFRTFFAVNDVIYAVGWNDALYWYKYTGTGVEDPSGSSDYWAPNSGNIIGSGWSDPFRAYIGVKQTIFAVTTAGNLLWYQYNGTGEQDIDGSNGSWAPNSGNQIGVGWADPFSNYFGTRAAIYTVTASGELHWYKYVGTGAPDPAGTGADWAPNSGNQIGNGWT